MDRITAQTELRKRIPVRQKAWKYIRDVTNTEIGNLNRTAIEDASAGQPGGFQLGGVEIPPQLLARLMQMDMSPENLSKLQKALDFLFEAMPQQNRGE